jgi:hypothetical protein
VKDLAAFGEESTNVSASIHGASKNLGVLMSRLRLADKSFENASQGDSFLHCAAVRGWGESRQVERQVVFDRGRGLYGLDFEGCADVGQRAGAERQRLWVVRLPSLVFAAEVERARVLEVRWQDDRLVTGLARQLYTEVPRVEGHEGKLQVLGNEVFLSKGIEAIDGVPESSSVADVFPCEGR